MLDLLQTGKFGVLTNQKLLGTTSNNITNVNTEGYTRQETVVYTSAIEWGVGSTVTRRLYDKYVQREMFRDQGNVGFYDAYSSGLGTVDKLLSSKDTSITHKLDSLFASMEKAAQNATSLASRQELLSQFQTLTDRYNTLNYNIKNELTDINNKIDDAASNINDLVKGLYEVNRSIRNLGQSVTKSDVGLQLLDKRDQMVNQLSEFVDVNVTTESDGSWSLYLGNGQLLVNGDTYGTLAVNQKTGDQTRREISLIFETPSKSKVDLGHDAWGGKLGGLLAASDEMRQAMRELGQSALAFADAMNTQNKGGITLGNVAGKDVITIPDVKGTSTDGRFAMTVSFNPGEGSDIRSDDYLVRFEDDGGNMVPRVYTVDANGKETMVPEADVKIGQDANGNMQLKVEGHGITLSFNATQQAMQNTDVRFTAQPTINSAFDIKCNITKPEDFAFSSAIRVNGNKHSGNATPSLVGVTQTGTAATDKEFGIYIDPTTGKPAFTNNAPNYVQVEKNAQGQLEYVVYHKDNAGQLTKLGTAPADCNGKNIFANTTWNDPNTPDGYPHYDVNFTGTVDNGSSFDIEINTDGKNDNTNGNLMAALKQENLVYGAENIKVSFTEDYANLTAEIGSAVMSATTDLAAAKAKCEQSQNLFASTAGVNLDEEAANLIRFQQSYSACARIINASQTIFDALMSAI
ncbi:flagellar hook-associated protein FlgK [Anaerobiospirillum sp. NML120449]|uniref:flagellar hook-associated protein FlgK n=1 Tax=Anaerobiospirillum sp. NML120449 TaxID=2932817 RepID=UPI001FF2CB2D|nr:flagellar hook-associated protein FlgK [Anaerobiospirillum sp. NML120449]MCK0526226.1 flagellar hook-associated protein FlgK [Anaerobiospirillum sp. NML120449]